MTCSSRFVAVALAGACWAGTALGQQIVSLGDGAFTVGVTAGATKVGGAALGGPAQWSISGTSVSIAAAPLPAGNLQTVYGMSDDGLYMTSEMMNSGGLGGLPVDSTMACRWDATNGWVNLGLMTPNPALGVAGSGDSGGISSPRGISATGRFVVGQGYIPPNWSFQFRPWVWDAQANAGAGEMVVLPTSYDAGQERYRDGRALAVSQDGSVIVGGESPNTGEGRVLVWRYDPNSSAYQYSYLPDAVDPNNQPVGRFVDSFLINAAGTIIVGTSFEWDPNLGYPDGPFLARWTWDPNTSVWNRELLGKEPTPEASWRDSSSCPIPPTIFPTGMSNDGKLITGLISYSDCGSFIRSAWIYDGRTRVAAITDLYDYLDSLGTAGLAPFASTGVNIPPLLGTTPDVDPNGQWLTGYGTYVQSSGGPAWLVKLSGSIGCMPPFVSNHPAATFDFSRCNAPILNGGGGGSMSVSYQWLKDGSPVADGPTGSGSTITGATTSQLRIEAPHPSDAGSYSLRVSNACGSPVTTSACTVQVDPNVTTLPNDTCLTAATIGQGTNVFPWSPCGAWEDDGIASCSPTFTDTADAWFQYTHTGPDGVMRIETCGATFDTILSVYSSCGGSELACNDTVDSGSTTGCWSGSRINLSMATNQTIWIRVSALGYFGDWSTGNISINPAPAPLPNDTCLGAAVALIGENPFDTSEATNDSTAGCNPVATRDVWYTFSPTLDGKLRLATCPGTWWGTVVSVYAGCGGAELACNDNADVTDCWSQSIISDLPVAGGDAVVIRVAADWPGSFGEGVLTVSFTCNVDASGNGLVDQDDLDLVLFYFGTSQPPFTNGDVDGDGDVDQDDLDLVLFYFGVTCS